MLRVIISVDQQAVLTEGTVSALIYFTLSFYEPNPGIFNHVFPLLRTEFCTSERYNVRGNSMKYHTVEVYGTSASCVLPENWCQWKPTVVDRNSLSTDTDVIIAKVGFIFKDLRWVAMVKRDLFLTQLGFMDFIYSICYVDVIINEVLFAFISILTKSPMYFNLSPFGLHQPKYYRKRNS